MDSNVPVSCPIGAERVIGFKQSLEMQGMFTPNILDAKIIHNEGESYWSSVVHTYAWDQFTLSMTVFVDVLFDELVGN